MTGDWLKVEKRTPDKAEILAIARTLNITPPEAFGRCFLVWRWAEWMTTDGNARSVTTSDIDRVAGLDGFSDALLSVGWLLPRSGSVQFPNFARHMGQAAKKRLFDAERQRECRVKKVTLLSQNGVTDESQREGVLEEKKEKKKKKYKTPPLPPAAGFDRFWAVWPKKVAKADAEAAWAKLAPGPELAEAIVAAVARQRGSPKWNRDGGRYIPYPATWLNRRRWEDEDEEVSVGPGGSVRPDHRVAADGGSLAGYQSRTRRVSTTDPAPRPDDGGGPEAAPEHGAGPGSGPKDAA